MIRDTARIDRIRRILEAADLEAILATLPVHVLLLSGYWPVVGNALAIATQDGRTAVIAPQDERGLAEGGWADEVRTFEPVSPDELKTLDEAVCVPLAEVARSLGLGRGWIGYARGPMSEPASYAAMSLYGPGVLELLQQALPSAHLQPADESFRRLEAVKTPREMAWLRVTCRIVEQAFRAGADQLRPGLLETEAAVHFAVPLSTVGTGFKGVGRGGGYAWCMSGPNAAEAKGAYARSRPRPLARGEMVLIHCNAYADGYWADVTRTFCLGDPDVRQGELFDAVLQARAAALGTIRPGARAADVDRAARGVLEDLGLGSHFKHPAGHGVGFQAIDHNARPRLHPKSDDVLEPGMVFNVEPAVYFDGDCGLRHCDMVAVTAEGYELLTPFRDTIEQLFLGQAS
jgi:Xaa-Pro aminopeptidase